MGYTRHVHPRRTPELPTSPGAETTVATTPHRARRALRLVGTRQCEQRERTGGGGDRFGLAKQRSEGVVAAFMMGLRRGLARTTACRARARAVCPRRCPTRSPGPVSERGPPKRENASDRGGRQCGTSKQPTTRAPRRPLHRARGGKRWPQASRPRGEGANVAIERHSVARVDSERESEPTLNIEPKQVFGNIV